MGRLGRRLVVSAGMGMAIVGMVPGAALAAGGIVLPGAGMAAVGTAVSGAGTATGGAVMRGLAGTATGAAPAGRTVAEWASAGGAAWPAAAGGAVRGGADLLGIGFQVININSGKCLTVVGAAMGDNAGIIQKTCTKEPAYRWRFVPVSLTGMFLIQNIRSGKCLTVAGGGLGNNDFAVQYTCDGSPARNWQLQKPLGVPLSLTNSNAQLVNERSDKCLTIAGGGVGENGVAVQYTCDKEESRRWTVRLIGGPIFDEPAPVA